MWKIFDCGPSLCFPLHLHLTTSKVMVIVWRLRGNIIRTVTSSMGTVNKNSSYSPVGPRVCLFVYLQVAWLVFMLVYVLFYLGQLSHALGLGAGVTNLNEPPSGFLLPPRCCGLGAGSIPLRAIVNKKQCETRRLFMSLVIHYWIGDGQDSQGVSISQNANYNFWRHDIALLCSKCRKTPINQSSLCLT